MISNLDAIRNDPVLKMVALRGIDVTAEWNGWKRKDLEEYMLEVNSRYNPEFFDKYNLVIQTKSGQLVSLVDNPVQKKIQEEIDRQASLGRPIRIKIPKARRHGVSTKTQAVFFSDAVYGTNLQMLTVCHDLDAASNMREMFERFSKHFPRKKQKFSSVRGSNKWWKSKATDVSYMIDTAEEVDTGRSFTYHRLHLSEVAFYRDPQTLMTGLLRSVDRNPNTMIIAESTANGMGGWWYDFIMNDNDYACLFFPWFVDAGNMIVCDERMMDEISGSLSEHEKWLIEDCNCTLDQLNWRRHEIKNGFNDDEDLFRQEYPSTLEESFITSGRPYFTPVTHFRREFQRTAKLPRRQGFLEWETFGRKVRFTEDKNGPWLIIELPEPGFHNRYVTGSDVAEGVAAGVNNTDPDYSVCTVFDRVGKKEVAKFRGRYETEEFGAEIYKASVFYGSACECVERNSAGIAVINYLKNIDGITLFQKEDLAKTTEDERAEYGFRVDVNSRDYFLSTLRMAIKQGQYKSDDNNFWDEITKFVVDEKGKARAQSGAHDDCVFSAGHTQQALSQAGPVEQITKPEAKKHIAGDVDIPRMTAHLPYAEF